MINVSKTAKIHSDSDLVDGEGELHIGDNCHIKKGVVINCYGGIVRIEHNVSIGEYTILYGHGGIVIGANVAIAPHCVLSAQKHISPANVPLRYSGEILNLIEVKENCIISAHVTITEGTSIGRNSFIGAGSVVTRDIPDYVFACGSPCKVVKNLGQNKLYGYTESRA